MYVISNVRSFGENVYKIGMTRRLEPMDRVRELSDASVPFAFDVHHMIYTDDAPKSIINNIAVSIFFTKLFLPVFSHINFTNSNI